MFRFLALFLVLAFSVVPVSAQRRPAAEKPRAAGTPRVSLPVPVSDVTYGPSGGDATDPRIAAGPDQALVGWSGCVVRVDSQGRALDAIPLIRIRLSGILDVAWDGSRYQVVTSESDGTLITTIRVTEIDTDGRIYPSLDVAEVSNGWGVRAVAIAASGRTTLVAYAIDATDDAGRRTAGTVFKGVVLSGGRVIKRFDLGTHVAYVGPPLRIAASPDGFLVWWQPWTTYFRVVTVDGSIIASGMLERKEIDAVWNGTAWEVAATDNSVGGVVVFPLSASGSVGTASVVHTTAAIRPAIAWNGSEYSVLWKDSFSTVTFDLRAAALSRNQEVIAKTALVPSIDTSDSPYWSTQVPGVAIGAVGSSFIPLWCDGPKVNGMLRRELWATAISATRLPTAEEVSANRELLSKNSVRQSVAGILAADDSARLFFYDPDILQYEVVDARGIRSSRKSIGVPNSYYGIVPNGLEALLTSATSSSTSRLLSVAVVDERGAVVRQFPIATVPFTLAFGPTSCNAFDCATVWYTRDLDYYRPAGNGVFQRFSSSGTLIGSPVALPPGFLALSGRGSQFLIIERWGTLDTDNRTIATRFADGKLSDVTDLIGSPVLLNGRVSTAAGPDGWLVALTDQRDKSYLLHLVHVDENANRTWSVDLKMPTIDAPRIVWDGRNWIVVWTRDPDIYAARLTSSGVLVDGTNDAPGFVVSSGQSLPVGSGTYAQLGGVTVSSGGNGLTAVAYTQNTNDAIYGESWRSFVRWIDNR